MAQHRYFVRKDPDSCKVEWNEMSGTEFYAFIKSTESADRHFANMGDFTIEMPADEFENWTKDRNRCAYLNNLKNGVTILSLQEEYQSDSGILEEHIQDPSVDIEGDVISNIEKKNLRAAVIYPKLRPMIMQPHKLRGVGSKSAERARDAFSAPAKPYRCVSQCGLLIFGHTLP